MDLKYSQLNLPEKNSGYEYAEVLKSIFNKDINIVDKTYDRAINQELPGGLKAYGVEEVKTFGLLYCHHFLMQHFQLIMLAI